MAFSAANLGGVADPRLDSVDADNIGTHRDSIIHEQFPGHGGNAHGIGPPDTHGHNTIYLDSSISFEAYNHYAKRARAFEKHLSTNHGLTGLLSVIGIGKKKDQAELASDSPEIKHATDAKDDSDPDSSRKGSTEKNDDSVTATATNGVEQYGITEAEWETAQRAGRTATWGAIFYLITTDILGPYSVPWAIAQLGYGPGVAIFVVFGVLAYYSGMQLWVIFKGLDSPRYPIRNYGDVAFRLFGNWARVVANFLQSFQFFLNVSLCIVANGQSLGQMASGQSGKGVLCFVVAQLIFTLIGFILGQIRTLQRLGWLANLAVWLNVTVIISSMYAVYKYPPNYSAFKTTAAQAAPIVSSAGLPPGKPLYDNVNGMFNGVFAFGGATMFYELMAEMRRPYDFWKGLLIAEIFITSVYLIYGLVVFSHQGQYTYQVAFQGISPTGYGLQTLGNALYFTVSIIAALLYGNIGLKVLYAAVMRDAFKFPPLETKKGKWTWAIFVPFYWALAFILAAAVPQIANLTAFEGALTIMQFSYTFPPLLMVAYNCQRDSALPGEQFDPQTGQTNYVDRGPKRWWRGYKKQFVKNTWDSLYFLAALATAILGIWASIVAMTIDFKATKVQSFTCVNPAGN